MRSSLHLAHLLEHMATSYFGSKFGMFFVSIRQPKHMRSISYFLVLEMALTFGQQSNAAQEICVVPEVAIQTDASCIKLNQLAEWLKRYVRRNSSGQVAEDVVVRIGPGVHRLSNPIVIDSSVWPPGGRQLRIEGAGADQTTISGAVIVSTNQTTDQERQDKLLPRDSIRIALSEVGITAPRSLSEIRFGKPSRPDFELFLDGHRLPRSRWPKSGYATISNVEEIGTLRFTIRNHAAQRYTNEPALMLAGYFAHDWAHELLNATVSGNIDRFTFTRTSPEYGVRVGQRVWVENALRDISQPGEWAYDPTNNSIYAIPVSNGESSKFEVSNTMEGFVFSKVWNVAVLGIGFTAFRDSAIRVDQGIDFTIRSVKINNIGGAALQLNGRGITAEDLHISDIGGGGVGIGGGDRKNLIPGRVALRRCKIERVGQLIRTYAPAVGIAGVGNEVSGCVLSDGPHAAILFHGNNHLIENNVIRRFALETDDAGAIYTGQDWTERGTIIRSNLIYDIGARGASFGVNAIYLDDQASGIIVADNVVINAQRGVLIGGGRDNQINGNTFVGCREGVYIDARGTQDIEARGKLANLEFHKKFAEVRADSLQYSTRYPELLAAGVTALGRAGNNIANDNLFVGCSTAFTVKLLATGALQTGLVRIIKVVPKLDEFLLNDPAQIQALREKLNTDATVVAPMSVTRNIP
jgi:parallel beta-helix repeat protein